MFAVVDLNPMVGVTGRLQIVAVGTREQIEWYFTKYVETVQWETRENGRVFGSNELGVSYEIVQLSVNTYFTVGEEYVMDMGVVASVVEARSQGLHT